jgi:two-component system chemotaxis sensor kinase CheA
MQIDLNRFREVFFEEAAEHLTNMEEGLLRLEENPRDAELLNSIFRSAHSIKGASGTFGFADIADFTHTLESLLDQLRDGVILATPELVDLLLKASDVLAGLVATAKTGEAPPPQRDAVLDSLQHALSAASPPTIQQAANTAAVAGAPNVVYRITLTPDRDLFRQGMDPLLLLRDLAQLGTVREVMADHSQLPGLAHLDPESCYLAWTLVLETDQPQTAIEDVFCFVRESCRITIEVLTLTAVPAPDAGQAPTAATMECPVGPAGRQSELQTGGTPVPAENLPPPAGGDSTGPTRSFQTRKLDDSSIRVAIDKVDKLVNLVEELVVSQSMLNQAAKSLLGERSSLLQEAVATMDRNLRDLQERVMAIRMVPLSTASGRFPRLVRELANSLGKKIVFEMVGQETELDKQVIERIGDPLTHLIRNAADHGIEPPEERLRQGKREEGTLRLTAFHQGDSVVIELTDDGRGLNTDRIREKGIALGLLRPDQEASVEAIHGLIFAPGFSTAATVSDVSGRGVGMDVVRRNVEALNGSISLSSQFGRGTRIRIKLPLTLAIVDGLCLALQDEIFILPLLSIVESLRPWAEQVRTVLGKGEVLWVRGEPLPLLRLGRVLGMPSRVTDPAQGLVVIAESEGHKIGILVDELLGQSQVVIKNLEAHYRKVEGIAGATILGDGRVALILDVSGLNRLASRSAASPEEELTPLATLA